MTESNNTTQIACRVCGELKRLDAFPKMPTGKYGRATRCKPCTAIYLKNYQAANKDKLVAANAERYRVRKAEYSAASRANYEKNKDAYKARAAKWAAENPEKRREVVRRYDSKDPVRKYEKNKAHRLQNPGLYAAHFKARQQRKRKAMPKWANVENIKAIYRQCAWVTRMTGVAHHVDHYYPLKNPLVCGLHNKYNLRIIPATVNLSKGNQIPPG